MCMLSLVAMTGLVSYLAIFKAYSGLIEVWHVTSKMVLPAHFESTGSLVCLPALAPSVELVCQTYMRVLEESWSAKITGFGNGKKWQSAHYLQMTAAGKQLSSFILQIWCCRYLKDKRKRKKHPVVLYFMMTSTLKRMSLPKLRLIPYNWYPTGAVCPACMFIIVGLAGWRNMCPGPT